jgi:uncharacterized RDD family membrane protein YckC
MTTMPLLYEQASSQHQILVAKLLRPLTDKEKQKLNAKIPEIEAKAHVKILKVETTPIEIRLYMQPLKGFVIPLIWAIAAIAIAIGLPVTAWFITQVPTGPLGLPQWFWVGVGVGIPLFGLALVLWMAKK